MVFFFQAEDGIRDIGVTGVQTCALPIYECFKVVGYQPPDQPPTWKTSGSLFVRLLSFDLLGIGDPTRSSRTPADIALGVAGAHKPYHQKKMVIRTVRGSM